MELLEFERELSRSDASPEVRTSTTGSSDVDTNIGHLALVLRSRCQGLFALAFDRAKHVLAFRVERVLGRTLVSGLSAQCLIEIICSAG